MRAPRGYQILKLESRSETKVRGFDDARDDISRRVADQKMRGELLKYLDRLREQATIVWKNDELKKAYELALQKRAKAWRHSQRLIEPLVSATDPRRSRRHIGRCDHWFALWTRSRHEQVVREQLVQNASRCFCRR